MTNSENLKITLISLHGLIRARNPELGRDADTGGQVKYVIELARELATYPNVGEVELLTKQIIDPKIDDDYAKLEESISPKAKIVRIPFGPRRYIRKESLWPYIELFIDQTIAHFKRAGLPDIIHGHYADAGLAGAQLARLLCIPFVFTGHSLGRVKQQRLALGKAAPEALERKFKFTTRIEAEEIALETASMIVTNTNQEVQQEYELYNHYVPSRMEVITPGVDLSSFTPVDKNWKRPQIVAKLNRFLQDSKKPLILTIARPNERKNIAQLVRVYGKSERLQELANLVMIMGTRDDLRKLPREQQTVINNVLYWIDHYDLYGKVAYPKNHSQKDIPELYRLAASTNGVFINLAITEPFGLTLLEAGATGLPIVATNDSGPRDIIANCQNGLLIDSLDVKVIERALLRVLTEPDRWQEWSNNGIKGVREHYTWQRHTKRYLRGLNDILEHSTTLKSVHKPIIRRLPEFDRLIITDLDNTLTGDQESLAEFKELIANNDHVGLGIATGRRLDSAMELIEELGLSRPDFIDTDVGTQLHYGASLTPDQSWRKAIAYAWSPKEIRTRLDKLAGLYLQKATNQSEFKISYEVDTKIAPKVTAIKKILREAGLRAKVLMSLGMYLDIIPVRSGSDMSIRHLLWEWGFVPEHILIAGNSGKNAGMLLGRTLGVVVGNYHRELNRLRNRPRVYFAKAPHAAGIIEGINYYNFLGKIVIPNDQID